MQLRGCAEDKTFPGLSSRPPDRPILSSSLKIIVTRTAALAVPCLTWPPRSPARSHDQVEPAVCGGQGQTLRQRRWEVRHSSVNREVSVINSQRCAFCQRGGLFILGPERASSAIICTVGLEIRRVTPPPYCCQTWLCKRSTIHSEWQTKLFFPVSFISAWCGRCGRWCQFFPSVPYWRVGSLIDSATYSCHTIQMFLSTAVASALGALQQQTAERLKLAFSFSRMFIGGAGC